MRYIFVVDVEEWRSAFEIGQTVLVRSPTDSKQRFWLADIVDLAEEKKGHVQVRWRRLIISLNCCMMCLFVFVLMCLVYSADKEFGRYLPAFTTARKVRRGRKPTLQPWLETISIDSIEVVVLVKKDGSIWKKERSKIHYYIRLWSGQIAAKNASDEESDISDPDNPDLSEFEEDF